MCPSVVVSMNIKNFQNIVSSIAQNEYIVSV